MMNYDRDIVPLRPDRREAARIERRSWSRALASYALSYRDNWTPTQVLRKNWPNDTRASTIIKAAQNPTSTSDFPPHDIVGSFRSLAPGSAAWKLFGLPSALKLTLTGINTVLIPNIAALPPAPVFVAEGAAAPAVQLNFTESTLGPSRKILVLSAITSELQHASPDNAAQVIGKILADASNRSIDTICFDANAGTTARPPGLLHNVTPTAAAAAGPDAMNEDVAALAAAVAANGIDTSDLVFIASAGEAETLKLKSGPNWDRDVLPSLGLPPKMLIAAAPSGIASGYQGPPVIESSSSPALVFDDTAPGNPPSPPSTRSAYQQDLVVVRVRAECAWAALPGSVQFVQSINW
jgi:hypothetical protein